ncbi:PREDICTED: L10-interacting MYB domain-containing protein-like [Prunus mume]|uniref:L10-interacting MYB domain-containing protein-like n=1 Tax=Prunus mume TaxID=102107 RepID=A0ABM0NNU0_PRUMU|nr:PREDICTED: L10-interacting MYB domain-containing protein-like [Prunus mume]
MSKETGAEYNKSQLKNKWDAFKEQWKIWKELIGKETGLGWNSKLRTVDASDEWWHNKIQINPKYAKLRRKGNSPDIEEKFDRMFMNTTATGDHAWAPSSGGTTSVMMKGSQGSSIAEVMKAVSSLPGAGPGSHLWLFATRLFLNQEKREMFTTMEDPNIKLQWLNYELSEK